MIIDSSAVIAVIRQEPERARLLQALGDVEHAWMSAASYVESGIVLDATRMPELARGLDRLLDRAGIEVVAVTPAQALIARQAYRDFGRGSGHRARLNFGDCFAYALAIDLDEPLLFKGDDFVHTDVLRVHY